MHLLIRLMTEQVTRKEAGKICTCLVTSTKSLLIGSTKLLAFCFVHDIFISLILSTALELGKLAPILLVRRLRQRVDLT